jgi:general transcription factor 3C polypeptide 3 (transcription factor C subunit 4)
MKFCQGLAFMSQYRKFRSQDPDGAQEVEYNFGRLFHQIGKTFWFSGEAVD